MSKFNVRISLGAPFSHSKLVLHESIRQDHLDLIGREESAGAGVPTVPERQAVLADTDELVQCRGLDRAAGFRVLS